MPYTRYSEFNGNSKYERLARQAKGVYNMQATDEFVFEVYESKTSQTPISFTFVRKYNNTITVFSPVDSKNYFAVVLFIKEVEVGPRDFILVFSEEDYNAANQGNSHRIEGKGKVKIIYLNK